MTRIAIADDHQLFRRSLAALIDTFDDMQVVLQAEDGVQLLDQLAESAVDLVLLDLQMPNLDGFATCAIIKKEFPDIKILIVSQLSSRESIFKVMELGADGFFTKNSNPEELENAIISIRDKDFYFAEDLSEVLKDALLWDNKKHTNLTPSLNIITLREMDVIRMACKELNSQAIAESLCISIRTVESHRKKIIEKTGAKNFIGVVLYALKHNLLMVEDIK
jgi:DNA-binding NarL/FixJ family response regulator